LFIGRELDELKTFWQQPDTGPESRFNCLVHRDFHRLRPGSHRCGFCYFSKIQRVWTQVVRMAGIIYDYLRLELDEAAALPK
jgi:hypothetical protein